MYRILPVVFFFSALCIQAEEAVSAFRIYGRNRVTEVVLPDSWTADMKFARKSGMSGFFYIKNFEREASPAAIALTLWAHKPPFEAAAEAEHRGFLTRHKGYEAAYMPDWDIRRKDGLRVRVYKLFNNNAPMCQYAAYIDNAGGLYSVFTLQIQNKNEDNKRAIAAYRMCIEKTVISDAARRPARQEGE